MACECARAHLQCERNGAEVDDDDASISGHAARHVASRSTDASGRHSTRSRRLNVGRPLLGRIQRLQSREQVKGHFARLIRPTHTS